MDTIGMTIKEWSEDERPREKMLAKGPGALSLSELFAVLLRSGTGQESALDLSRRILGDSQNNLNDVAMLSVTDLIKRYRGVGIAKACAIVAAMEIGRRRTTTAQRELAVIKCSKDAYSCLFPYLSDLDHEEFWTVFMTHSNRVISIDRMSSGGMSSTVTDVRMIFKQALDYKAHFILISHNHPSGLLKPSSFDKSLTEKIFQCGKMMDILLYDHIIVGKNEYLSFADEGLLTF